ncbi:MAG: S41 family peptidase [Phycisphaerae bacterium]|nr:S41 family peptidase [Phycisphaerae bacterium]
MQSKRKLLSLVILAVLALPAAADSDGLQNAYGDILAGDYEAGRAAVDKMLSGDTDVAQAKTVQGWLADYQQVVAARKDVDRQTFDWNVAEAQKALAAGEIPLALTFTARAVPYADSEDPFAGVAWVDDLARLANAKADEMVAEQNWSDAATIYVSLSRIRPNDKDLEKTRDRAVKHARVELLYKNEEEYKRRVEDVNDNLLRNAIRKISSSYYEKPDFRKAAEGALDNLVTLCETSKLYDYLDGIANPAARELFLKKLEQLRTEVQAAKRFDDSDLMGLYSEVSDASRASVELDEGLLVTEFVEGALDELDDFTAMVWPVDASEFDKIMMGGFEGVGIQLGMDETSKRLKVITPLENSPALEAGIRAGDLIVEVNGESTKGWDTNDAVRNIMGPANTEVKLTMYRPGIGKRITFPLTRRQIVIKTVRGVDRLEGSDRWNYILDDDAGIGYVRLTGFHPDSGKELKQAVETAREQGMRGLVLDLRGNPGGLLDVAIEIVGMFVQSGEVVSTNGAREREEHYDVSGKAEFAELPLIVLVNESSASASEILAGAMQDHHRALVLGERTFGKGSVQRVLPLGTRLLSSARLKLTTALYYLPSGRSPHKNPDADKWGIDPDIEVKLSPKEYRKVIERENASYIIRNGDSPGDEEKELDESELQELADTSKDGDDNLLSEADLKRLEADPIDVADTDPQLQTALLMMRVKLVSDLAWPRNLAARDQSAPSEP